MPDLPATFNLGGPCAGPPKPPANLPINLQRTPCADKNDRLGWKAGFSLQLEGISFGVRSNSPEALPALRALFPASAQHIDTREVEILLSFMEGGETARKGVKNYHIVYDAWNRVARTMDREEALQAFHESVELYRQALSKERFYLEADVLAWNQKGVLIVGDIEVREAFVETLLAEGATRHCRQAILDEHQLLQGEGLALPPGLTIFAKSGKARRARVTPPLAALELFRHAHGARYQPQRILGKVAALSQAAPVFRASAGTAGELSRFLRRQLG